MPEAPTGYKEVKAEIVRRVRDRTWPPGALLPSEIDLSGELGCARATVNRAMRELADEGLLERRRRAGTRVRTAPQRQARLDIPITRDEVEATGAAYRYALVERSVGPAPDWLSARIGLPSSGKVLHLIAMHFADQSPYQHEERWINLAAVPDAAQADFSRTGPNEWLVRDMPFNDIRLDLRAGAATPTVAAFLEIAIESPVFVAERVTRLDGVAITLARLSFPPGYRMRLQT